MVHKSVQTCWLWLFTDEWLNDGFMEEHRIQHTHILIYAKSELPIFKMYKDIHTYIHIMVNSCLSLGDNFHMAQVVSLSVRCWCLHAYQSQNENRFFKINAEKRCLLFTSLYPLFVAMCMCACIACECSVIALNYRFDFKWQLTSGVSFMVFAHPKWCDWYPFTHLVFFGEKEGAYNKAPSVHQNGLHSKWNCIQINGKTM